MCRSMEAVVRVVCVHYWYASGYWCACAECVSCLFQSTPICSFFIRFVFSHVLFFIVIDWSDLTEIVVLFLGNRLFDPCLSNPCENSGTCRSIREYDMPFMCECSPPYRGHQCKGV